MSDPRLRLVGPPQQATNMPLDAQKSVRPHRLLGRILIERGASSSADILSTLGAQSRVRARLGQLLHARGLAPEAEVYAALAEQCNAPFVDIATLPPEPALLRGLDAAQCCRFQAIPWQSVGGATVIATSTPERFDAFCETLPAHLFPVRLAIACPSEIDALLQEHLGQELARRAETLVPDALSCREMPARLGKLCFALVIVLALALALGWFNPADLLFGLFALAGAMVMISLSLKGAAFCARFLCHSTLFYDHSRPPGKLPSISLLVPLHDEADIADYLLARLKALEYPDGLLDVLLITEVHDTRTTQHLLEADLPPWMRVLTVPKGVVTTKPRAMNYALPFCRGEIVGVYDAEDAPEHDQLLKVASIFAHAPAHVACIQGILDYYNSRSNLMARFFTIEYGTWFRLVLPGVARLGFLIPLGGTTIFFRRSALEEVHGWDAHNVTEDADLGVRLARFGYETVLMHSATYEEATNRVWPWIKQRSRWLKGYVLTYATHMRHPLSLLRDLGGWKFFGYQLFFLSTICQFLLAPLIWSSLLLSMQVPLWVLERVSEPQLWFIASLFFGLWLFNLSIYAVACLPKDRRYLLPILPLIGFYMLLGSAAIYKGIWELVTKPFYWDKTGHGHSLATTEAASLSSSRAASNLSRVTKATDM